MSAPITPTSRMGALTKRTVVVSSAFLYGPVTPWAIKCVAGQRTGLVVVNFSPVRGAARPTVRAVPSATLLESFVQNYCNIDVVGRITLVDNVGWPLIDRGMATRVRLDLPPGLTFDDVYPGISDLRDVTPGAAPHVSYILGRVDAPAAPEVARARADSVKDAYGQLLSDLIYRIESPALFDHAVPESREFQLLLMRWEDEQHSLASGALNTLARELQLAFDKARAHSETVGLSHLPRRARRRARQALKAAELAEHGTTDGERVAARTKVARLLGSIALYYLPSPADSVKMLGASPPQLP